MGVVPRQFLRTFVNVLDVLADDPDQDAHGLLGFEPKELTPEEVPPPVRKGTTRFHRPGPTRLQT